MMLLRERLRKRNQQQEQFVNSKKEIYNAQGRWQTNATIRSTKNCATAIE